MLVLMDQSLVRNNIFTLSQRICLEIINYKEENSKLEVDILGRHHHTLDIM